MIPEIDSKRIQDFIYQEIIDAHKSGGVIGLSGGIDSTLTAYLTKLAFDHEEKLTLTGLIMPSATNSPADMIDAQNIGKKLEITTKIIPIESIIDSFRKTDQELYSDRMITGNLAARIRMCILYTHAQKLNALVIGTDNYDESSIGYFTKYGDGGVDINPIGGLSKRMVRQMAEYLGIPKEIIQKEPTAGLFIGQTDAGEIGCDYSIVEKIMNCHRGYNGRGYGYNNCTIAEYLTCKLEVVEKVIEMHYTSRHKVRIPPAASVGYLKNG